MSRKRRKPARNRFLTDQRDAAAEVVTHQLVENAGRFGRRLTELSDHELMDADPLASWFIRWHLKEAVARRLTWCPHLTPNAPAPQRWDSALPTGLFCEALCSGAGYDLQMRAQGFLPARCGRCARAGATKIVEIALGQTRLIGRVCADCMETYSPSTGDAA